MRHAKEELTRRLDALGGPLRANDSRVKEEIVRAFAATSATSSASGRW